MTQHFLTLSNGVRIPRIIFGTYKAALNGDESTIRLAIDCGYRGFDTASFYGNEQYVGTAVQRSGIPREELFLTSKLWKTEMGYRNAKEALSKTLENLKTDYLDLYLIHWPLPSPDYRDWKQLDLDTWRALEEAYESGIVKSIGLSNFLPHHIENIIQNCRVRPMVDQMEYHPGHSQEAVLQYCRKQNILVQAWSPLGRKRILEDPLILSLADKYQVTPAQICLKFSVQRGVIPLPKASDAKRMKENLDLFSFELETEDLYQLMCMPPSGWSGEHPDRERLR